MGGEREKTEERRGAKPSGVLRPGDKALGTVTRVAAAPAEPSASHRVPVPAPQPQGQDEAAQAGWTLAWRFHQPRILQVPWKSLHNLSV